MRAFFTSRIQAGYAEDALSSFRIIKGTKPSFLLESSSHSERLGRLSLIGIDPVIELKGKDSECSIRLLEERGRYFFDTIYERFKEFSTHNCDEEFKITIPCSSFWGEEKNRIERNNIVQIIRSMLSEFHQDEKNFLGLYGALAYRFIYQFEDIKARQTDVVPDFHLFLYDTFILFNHLTKESTIIAVRSAREEAEKGAYSLQQQIEEGKFISEEEQELQLNDIKIEPSEETYKKQVSQARTLCEEGELLEIVLSRKLSARFTGDPLTLYTKYKQINPTPYLFYFDLGGEYLVGASPEMMLRYEHGKVTIRPISGTIARGKNPIEDHDNLVSLLTSTKDKAELDMLIDLGRNDLARVCKPGITIEDYRYVEKYSHLMHTVAEISGTLEENRTGFDALISCLNAGTLTGAPKLAAMRYIDEIEGFSRGYYGGSIGYFLFSGEVDTAILIRTAHIKDGELSYYSGATLLYDSDPESELGETKTKAAAFLKIFEEKREYAEV